MKTIIKAIYRCLINLVCKFFPIKNEVIFESNPDLSCNSYELFKTLVQDQRFKDFSFVLNDNSDIDYKYDNDFSPIHLIEQIDNFLNNG